MQDQSTYNVLEAKRLVQIIGEAQGPYDWPMGSLYLLEEAEEESFVVAWIMCFNDHVRYVVVHRTAMEEINFRLRKGDGLWLSSSKCGTVTETSAGGGYVVHEGC